MKWRGTNTMTTNKMLALAKITHKHRDYVEDSTGVYFIEIKYYDGAEGPEIKYYFNIHTSAQDWKDAWYALQKLCVRINYSPYDNNWEWYQFIDKDEEEKHGAGRSPEECMLAAAELLSDE